jgi:hypothetical protein
MIEGFFPLSPNKPLSAMSLGLIQLFNMMCKVHGVSDDRLREAYNACTNQNRLVRTHCFSL